jgi:hypothetical protein
MFRSVNNMLIVPAITVSVDSRNCKAVMTMAHIESGNRSTRQVEL